MDRFEIYRFGFTYCNGKKQFSIWGAFFSPNLATMAKCYRTKDTAF